MVKYKVTGDFNPLRDFLKARRAAKIRAVMEKYAQVGVKLIASNTPVDTGTTANSWYYEIESGETSSTIYFKNSNVVNGVPVAVLIQYGHATKNGGYVEGIDFINPALRPIFDDMVEKAWREVTSR